MEGKGKLFQKKGDRMKIGRAFCQQLNRIVTIDEARREYFSHDDFPERFVFLCSSEACRENHHEKNTLFLPRLSSQFD